MLSPRSSMGGESPLKPPSMEASPSQKKDQDQDQEQEDEKEKEKEKESEASSSIEPAQKGEDTGTDTY